MRHVDIDIKFASEEEYFLFEEKSELRHELINGNLYEMSGVSVFHNEICGNIFILLKMLLKSSRYKVFFENFKLRTPDSNFFYPNVMVCEEAVSKYYSERPVLIVEVLSETTRKYDLADKFIQYQKIKSLNYYLCVEPEIQAVFFFLKNDDGEWIAETFLKEEDKLDLKTLNITFTLKDIYKPE